MQSLTIIGNLGADAKVIVTDSTKFVSFKVADTTKFTNQKGETKETTTWVSCVLNGDGGNLLPYLKQGVKVCVIGRPSYRVYSSEKDRCMKAGVELHVLNVELCGGSDDAVPRSLVTPEGVLVKPKKLFWIEQPKKNQFTLLYDAKGQRSFDVNKNGFITPHNNEQS